MAKNIGLNVPEPNQECNDPNCPFHGSLRVRGRSFKGTVISTKMQKSCTVEWAWRKHLPKYERYESRRTKVKAHCPECLGVKEGDIVRIVACRPLSKTKNFVVVQVIGAERGFTERIEARQEAKARPLRHAQMKQEEEKEEVRPERGDGLAEDTEKSKEE